jgi:hypothetical protein
MAKTKKEKTAEEKPFEQMLNLLVKEKEEKYQILASKFS